MEGMEELSIRDEVSWALYESEPTASMGPGKRIIRVALKDGFHDFHVFVALLVTGNRGAFDAKKGSIPRIFSHHHPLRHIIGSNTVKVVGPSHKRVLVGEEGNIQKVLGRFYKSKYNERKPFADETEFGIDPRLMSAVKKGHVL